MAESDLVDLSRSELLGSSGGALTACGLVLGLEFDDIAEFALRCGAVLRVWAKTGVGGGGVRWSSPPLAS